MSIKKIVVDLFPFNRELVSEGLNEALTVLRGYLPPEAEYAEEIFAPGSRVWTWRVPERYIIHEAYLETETGERVLDVANHRLHVFSYSLPVDQWLTWEELEPRLYYSTSQPDSIPWGFTPYERQWGFCLSKLQFDRLPRDVRYHAVIKVEYDPSSEAGLRVGTACVHPQGGPAQRGEILICAHLDHPMQANDGISGVAVGVEVIRRLAANPLPAKAMTVRFLFSPETIGSIAYLSHHEDLIPRFNAGLFIEMAGNRNRIALQRSFQDDHLIDRVARYVLRRKDLEFFSDGFRKIVGNDEGVLNGPGVNIPTISLSRHPFKEYHTSNDTPNILHEDMLQEMADVVEEIVRIYATNYVPRRKFRGPVFLSGYGLWINWKDGEKLGIYSLQDGQESPIVEVEQIMWRLEGKQTVFDIVEELNMEYWPLWRYLNLFHEKGLIERQPVPRVEFNW
jgi:aminopeptidase-like protein